MSVTNIEIGQNVQRARYRRGWTQTELAAAAGVDRSTVSRIEQGRRPLTAVELAAFAEVLRVSVFELLKPNRPPLRAASLTRMLQRAGPASPNDEHQLGWFVALLEEVEAAAVPAAFPAPPARLSAFAMEAAGELGARWARRKLELGSTQPVASVSRLLYERGISVVAARLPSASRLAGCAVVFHGGLRDILVNANHPLARRRFTALHELAHLLFDFDAEGAATACDAGEPRPGPRSPAEVRADAFAGAFLLPHRAVLAAQGEQVDLERVRFLAETYRVSHAAAVRRLRELGRLTDERARELRKLARAAPGERVTPPFRLVGESLARLLDDAGARRAGDEHGYDVLPDAEVIP